MVLFAVIIILHYASLKLQATYEFYTKKFGSYGFTVHFVLTSLLWLLLLYSFWTGTFEISPLPIFRPAFIPIGFLIKFLGIILIIWSFMTLGVKRAWGARYFIQDLKKDVEIKGPYRWLINPIYDGIFLFLLGKGLSTNSMYYFILSLESFVLLNLFLASFENKEIKK